MQARDIMTRNLHVASPDDTVEYIARLMTENDIGAVPVCDGTRLTGMLTDRDITIRVVAEGRNPASCRAADVMTREVRWCEEGDTVEEISRKMGHFQMRRLPVLDQEHRLVGIVSLGDLAVEPVADTEAERALSDISRPAHHP